MIRPYLRGLINDHKSITESYNEKNDSDADRETSNDKGSEFIPESVELLYYYF